MKKKLPAFCLRRTRSADHIEQEKVHTYYKINAPDLKYFADEENFIVSIPENILSFVGNQDTSTERVRKCRANKKENESMLHEENLMFRENDNDIEKQQHLLQKTNETLHETNGTLHVLEETDETVDQIRVDKNRKDKIRSSEINTSMNCNKNMEVAQIWQS